MNLVCWARGHRWLEESLASLWCGRCHRRVFRTVTPEESFRIREEAERKYAAESADRSSGGST